MLESVNRLSKLKARWYFAALVVVVAFIVFADVLPAANEQDDSPKYGIFDPISLSVIAYDGEFKTRSTNPPVLTLREWIRIPYRPPVRSPFIPED